MIQAAPCIRRLTTAGIGNVPAAVNIMSKAGASTKTQANMGVGRLDLEQPARRDSPADVAAFPQWRLICCETATKRKYPGQFLCETANPLVQ
jgi:hypothetical protein